MWLWQWHLPNTVRDVVSHPKSYVECGWDTTSLTVLGRCHSHMDKYTGKTFFPVGRLWDRQSGCLSALQKQLLKAPPHQSGNSASTPVCPGSRGSSFQTVCQSMQPSSVALILLWLPDFRSGFMRAFFSGSQGRQRPMSPTCLKYATVWEWEISNWCSKIANWHHISVLCQT